MWRNIVRASAGKLPRFMDQYRFLLRSTRFARPCGDVCRRAVAGAGPQEHRTDRAALRPAVGRSCSRRAKEVLALQRFLTDSPWDPQDVQYQLQAHVAEELLPSAAASPLGVVGVIDESSFEKSGPHSVGVKRQYCGHLGKTDNCQVGVFLIATVPAGEVLLDHQLYLPKEWINDRTRRKKARVPRQIQFQTKPQLAAELIRRTTLNGHVQFDWIVADDHYGENGGFLDALESADQRYMVETPVTTTFWTGRSGHADSRGMRSSGRPHTQPSREHVRSAREIIATLPPDAWRPIKLREGAKGPLVFEYARCGCGLSGIVVRVLRCGWCCNVRWTTPLEVKVWVSNADEQTPLDLLAQAGATRFRVELFFEEAKGELGMGHYEARAWTSWHHHMALVGDGPFVCHAWFVRNVARRKSSLHSGNRST